MDELLTKEELFWLDICNKATPWPWYARQSECFNCVVLSYNKKIGNVGEEFIPRKLLGTILFDSDVHDANFVVIARHALPKAIETIMELRREIQELKNEQRENS